jgi:hypothetical protein
MASFYLPVYLFITWALSLVQTIINQSYQKQYQETRTINSDTIYEW